MFSIKDIITALVLIASIATPIKGHSWIEEYQVIGSNGNYVGPQGYSRGYVSRTDPSYTGDSLMYLLPSLEARSVAENGGEVVRLRINSSDLVCHPKQRTSNYNNPEFPMLKAAPGDFVAAKYLENGHTTLPWNQPGKPKNRGTVYIYGTTDPKDDERMVDILKWNADGSAGDKRGFLMSAQDFDDGRCHQINNCVDSVKRQALFPNKVEGQDVQGEQWCESDFQIPPSQKPGKLTTYWVWQWPTAPNVNCDNVEGKDEYYTTCADFEIGDAGIGEAKIAAEAAPVTLGNWQTKAVANYKYRTRMDIPHDPVILADLPQNQKRDAPTNYVKIDAAFSSSCAAAATLPPDTQAAASCPAGKWATGSLSDSIMKSAVAAAKTSPPVVMAKSTTPPAPAWGGEAAAVTKSKSRPAATGASSPGTEAPPAQTGASVVSGVAQEPSLSTLVATSTLYKTTVMTSVITISPSAAASSPPAAPSASAVGSVSMVSEQPAKDSSLATAHTRGTSSKLNPQAG
ncbi:hypothetical protein LTR37_000247 [Vermiconidia calcicola]|uniref:Uncharacterized protein n=1 Tax=Vermiconidia calcicola TaxID=1690605 RepID=A0ACC3P1W3_9PEZI|nr:hypothetical protein LTR37_000247 [Vermiconidia calcicola]